MSTSYLSKPPSLMSRRMVVSGGGGGGGGGGVGEGERAGRDFEDFGFGPVPAGAVEAGFESIPGAECLILLEGGGLTSSLTTLADVGRGELSRLERSIALMRLERGAVRGAGMGAGTGAGAVEEEELFTWSICTSSSSTCILTRRGGVGVEDSKKGMSQHLRIQQKNCNFLFSLSNSLGTFQSSTLQ